MAKNSKLTPAMRQYMQIKEELSEDTILFFRMGDFYELFFEDAEKAAPIMGIVLTKRASVPMCGFPHHSSKPYINALIKAGLKVGMAEQLEDPKQAKGIVKRGLVQIITPGTVLDDEVLNANKSNFLISIIANKKSYALALLDVSTGDFRVCEVDSREKLDTELHRLQPAECLLAEELYGQWEKSGFPDLSSSVVWTPLDDWLFDYEISHERLTTHFKVASLDGFGCRGFHLAICAAGALLHYTRNNLRRDANHITSLQAYQTDSCMVMDRISQRNLELIDPIFTDSKKSTLLSVLDKTVTPMGGRLLREWILRPLRNCDEINRRLDVIAALVYDPMLLNEIGEALAIVRDLERTIMRLNVGSACARDLVVLKHGLEAVPALRSQLEMIDAELVCELRSKLTELPLVTELITNAITDEPPQTIKDGGIINDGYNTDLDEYRSATTSGKSWIASYQKSEQERTGIKSLKVRYNKVFGYYLEVTRTNLDLVPENYIRKQTLVNAERYITPELKEIEDKILGAEEKSKALEYELFQEVRSIVVASTEDVQAVAKAIAITDVLCSLAITACYYNYTRPELTDEPILDIVDGRHPVVEALLDNEPFVPNDTLLDTTENQLAIITGPNMAGKSTYIRQVAMITLMAQIGSFIPAKKAKIGIVDRIFTRIGAADDISRGQSTFMVEMIETANILNNATASSLIILDEIGRGTSTFDGLSLAWAVAEFLHDNDDVKARTLFATHYHELTELSLTMNGVKNYNVAVKDYGEKVIFLRKIIPGGADKSYGIHVARLAGLPKQVIERAKEVLTNLESKEFTANGEPKIAKSAKPNKKRKSRKKQLDDQPLLFDF